jgi:hypothetical protein
MAHILVLLLVIEIVDYTLKSLDHAILLRDCFLANTQVMLKLYVLVLQSLKFISQTLIVIL